MELSAEIKPNRFAEHSPHASLLPKQLPKDIWVMSSDPMLPPELERHIFEYAAFLYPETMPHLMLVAHRVKIWFDRPLVVLRTPVLTVFT